MKNLKKVLSLALAFAMVLGLCIGAMAADTKTQNVTTLKDWADVTNKDAAQLLNAFNIMQGDGNGNFRPADPVTRAEAAKMIAVALWGGDDLKDWFTGDSTTFTDVKSTDWFAGYVNYAATTGIVAGRNATTFDPQGKVTGYELLKMTLTALGYDQDEEGLVGAGWQVNTMRIAIGSRGQKNLTDDVEITNWDLPINREDTAQVIANMVYRTAVTYNNDGNLINVIDPSDSSKTLTFGTYYLGLEAKDAILVANTYGKVTKIGETNLTINTTADATKGQNSVINILTANKTIDASGYVAVTTTSGLYDLGATAKAYYKDGKVFSVAITAPAAVTPAADGSNYANTDLTKLSAVAIGDAITTDGHAYPTTLDTNADGKIDLITTVNYANIGLVTDVVTSEKHGTVYVLNYATWNSTYEKRTELTGNYLDNVVFADGVAAAEGDLIAYVNNGKNACDKEANVAVVLDSIDGTIDRVVSGTTDYTYYIDGVAHKGEAQGEETGYAFGAEGTFYFYPDGYIADFDGPAPAADQYAVIFRAGYEQTEASTGINGGKGSVKIQVAATLQDNTTGIFDLVSWNGAKVADMTSADKQNGDLFYSGAPLATVKAGSANLLVTYTLSDDGKSIAVKTIAETDTTVTGEMKTGSAKLGSKYFDSKSVTFIGNDKTDATEAWTAYVGIPTFDYTVSGSTIATKNLYTTSDGIKAIMVTNGRVEVTSTAFVYVLENKGQTGKDSATGSAIFTMTVYDAAAGTVGDVEVVTAGSQISDLKTVKAGDFFKSYTASGKALGDKIEISDTYVKGFVTTCGNGVVVLTTLSTDTTVKETKNVYTYDTTTKFYVIDGEDSKAITAADVTAQVTDPVGTDGKDYDVFYQAIVELSGTTAKTVIVFADRQGTTPVTAAGTGR